MKGSLMASSRPPTRAAGSTAAGESAEIKNYRLDGRIAQDELAVIYRAYHQTLDREVRLHVLRRSGWVAVSRFQLAARLAAHVQHAHIVPVLDAGHDERYGYYLVTPPLAAEPLAAMLEQGRLEAPIALRIFVAIAQALDELHRRGVVHRDVQPQTILAQADGSAYLTGFSLASSPDGPDLSSLDEADYLTPYAAPEQTFENGAPEPALDLYALGAVLYHMLSGSVPPGPGSEPPALAASDASLAGVDKVLRRMMAPQPQLRYSTAGQAAAALRSALRDTLEPAARLQGGTDAQWLENPLEIVLRDKLDADWLTRTTKRAEELHGGEGVRRLLDAWAGDSPVRRRQLGQSIALEQVVSYNLYFYDLKVLYETRSSGQIRERPISGSRVSSRSAAPDRWDVDVAVPDQPFAAVEALDVEIPHSERTVTCPRCQGETHIACPRCQGRGTLDVKRTVKTPSGSHSEVQTVDCPECNGQAQLVCDRCDGQGNLLETNVFTFSRSARLWQNTDELEGLPRRTLEERSAPVFSGSIDLHDPAWHAVLPLHELIKEAAKQLGDETRAVDVELTIRGTPVTEVDYTFRDKPRTLAIIGFDDKIRGDLSLFDSERLLIGALAVLLALAVAVLLFVVLRG